jgi:hypothetical protein
MDEVSIRITGTLPEAIDAQELGDGDLLRELASLHRTRNDTFLHGPAQALAHHTERMDELEIEYLRRFPQRNVDAARLRPGH